MAQGHPMAMPHNPQQGQPGPGMPQQMHMGVSGPGPQVSQGAMMGGIPPGAGGPSAHALQHLNPGQAQQAQLQYQQQQAMCKCLHLRLFWVVENSCRLLSRLFVTGRMLTRKSNYSREQSSTSTTNATTADDSPSTTATTCSSNDAGTTIQWSPSRHAKWDEPDDPGAISSHAGQSDEAC
jgi:hypothetical protein